MELFEEFGQFLHLFIYCIYSVLTYSTEHPRPYLHLLLGPWDQGPQLWLLLPLSKIDKGAPFPLHCITNHCKKIIMKKWIIIMIIRQYNDTKCSSKSKVSQCTTSRIFHLPNCKGSGVIFNCACCCLADVNISYWMFRGRVPSQRLHLVIPWQWGDLVSGSHGMKGITGLHS